MKFLKKDPKLAYEASPPLPRDFSWSVKAGFMPVVNYFHKMPIKRH
jgi:hypothetical protein